MCGRYTLSAGHEELARAFLAEFARELQESWRPRYNIGPGSGIVAVYEDPERDGARRAGVFHWGLVPHWARDPNIGLRLVNARAETVARKPAYREAFRRRRCLVPASGFYEWDRRLRPAWPYYIYPAGEPFMALAGVWEHWRHAGGTEIVSVALITMPANSLVGRIHDRMPLILPRGQWDAWLDCSRVPPDIAPFLEAAPPPAYLAMHPVGPEVNRVANDSPSLIEPAQPRPEGGPQLTLF